MPFNTLNPDAPCPCGYGSPYSKCCGVIHAGAAAPTAVQLMRSRYSAFVLGLGDYLLHSWHSSTRPTELELDAEMRWLRLIIEDTTAGGPFDDTGTVTFTAIGREAGTRFEQHETSRFARENGRWVYVDGDHSD